jgi:hypothetical protein
MVQMSELFFGVDIVLDISPEENSERLNRNFQLPCDWSSFVEAFVLKCYIFGISYVVSEVWGYTPRMEWGNAVLRTFTAK